MRISKGCFNCRHMALKETEEPCNTCFIDSDRFRIPYSK